MHNIYEETGIMKNTKLCKILDLKEEKALVIRGENKYLSGIIVYKGKGSIPYMAKRLPSCKFIFGSNRRKGAI